MPILGAIPTEVLTWTGSSPASLCHPFYDPWRTFLDLVSLLNVIRRSLASLSRRSVHVLRPVDGPPQNVLRRSLASLSGRSVYVLHSVDGPPQRSPTFFGEPLRHFLPLFGEPPLTFCDRQQILTSQSGISSSISQEVLQGSLTLHAQFSEAQSIVFS